MRKRLMILALVLIAVLMTCTLAACSGGGGRCSDGHTWDEGTVKEAATCLESGTLINKCTVCGIKREVAIEALGHDLQTIPSTVVEPTCEVDGYAGKKACVREGCEYVIDTGTIIPAIGHAYGDWTSNGDGTHKRVCANDSNHVESGNCSGGTADCGHKAVCDVCGGEYGDFASSHVFDKQVTTDAYKATDATCEAKATYYYSCQCGEKGTETFEYGDYADHVFDKEVTDAEYLVNVATCTSPAIYNKSCACGLEGTETFEFGDALPHTFDNEVVSADYKATDATCTAKATYYYSCDCGAHGTATFAYGDMLAHVYDKEVAEDKYLASAATCEKKATYYKSCYCGHFDVDVSATFESGELGDHVYDNKVVNETYKATDATCTEKATYYFSCDCGKAGTETFENGETLPHTYDKEVTEGKYLKFAANCASAAVYYKSCACGHFDTETSPTFYFGAPSGNHVYDREVVTNDYKATDSTCTAKATYYYSCECSEKGTTTFESGATLDHTMTHTPAKAATCVSTGNVEYWTCSTCSLNYDSATGGNVIEDVTTAIDSTNHVHTTISKPAVAPDCENTGLTAEISCSDCDKVLEEREEVPALGHKGGTATCKDKAVCEVCGEAYGDLANHTPGEIEVENNVAPSCTAEGSYDNVVYCTVCEHELSRETITTDALEHAYGEWVSNGNDTHSRVCGNDDSHVETDNCSGGAATLTEKAICSVCGEAYGETLTLPTAPVTVSTMISEYAAANGWDNETKHLSISLDSFIKVSVTGGTYTGKYYTSNGSWRIYQNENPVITFETTYDSIQIVSIKIEYSIKNSGVLIFGEASVPSKDVVVVNQKSVVFSVGNSGNKTNGNIQITSIEVVYEALCSHNNKASREQIDATCEAQGITAGTYCFDCNKYLDGGHIIEALGHNYGAWTSNDDGTHTHACVNVGCNKSESEDCSCAIQVVLENHANLCTEATCLKKATYYLVCECGYFDANDKTNVFADGPEPAGHTDENKDNVCDVCESTIVPLCAEHTYTDDCDAECEVCHFVRNEIPHKWSNACDAECDCGATRTVADHIDETPADCVCDECSAALKHKYANDCDAECDVCGESREAYHAWENDCDTYCDLCGATREVADHADSDDDGKCDRCGTDLKASASEITASKTIAELIVSEGWTSSTTKQSFKLDENVAVKIDGGSNTGKAYNGDHIRIYATDSPAGTITISVPEGYELVSVKITAQVGTYAFLYLGEGTTDVCNVTTAVSGQSVVLNSVKNGSDGKQVRVTAIEVVYREVMNCEHVYVAGNVVGATCEEQGYTVYACSKCNATENRDYVPALGHKYDQNNTDAEYLATPATCTAKATYYKSCSCGQFDAEKSEKFEYGEIAVDAHDWDEGVYTEPTCTADGYTTYTCKNNAEHKKVVTKENSKLDHSWVETSRTEATCVATGAINFVCEHDNSHTKTETIGINANAHDLVKRDAKAPTCTEIGWDAYEECSLCDYTTYDEKSALGHNEVEHEAKAPTCEEIGWDAYVTCSRCDYSTYDEKAATGHKYDSAVTDPTCEADGYTTYTCSVCKHSYTSDTTDKLGHKDEDRNNVCDTCKDSLCEEHTSNKWESNETHHWHICTACGFRFGEVAHTAGEVEVENNVDPTCTTEGSYDNVVYCTVCNAELSRETITVDATDHDYQAVVTAPTCTADGYTTHTCSKCGDSYEDTYVDKLDHDLVTAYEVVVVGEVNTLHKVTKCVREGCEHIAEDVTVDTTNSVAVANEKDLRTVLENGFKAQLAEDVDLVKGSIDLVGVSATLDLNGHDISVVGTKYAETTGKHVCGVFHLDGATLTIDGDGELFASIDNADSIYVISAINGSNVTLNGGTYRSSGCTTIYGRTNTTITINGGTYIAEVVWDGLYFTLDILEGELKDGTNATINVYGGTFHNFDPANHTNDGTYTNKVMDGYHSIKDGDNYVVGEHTEVVDAAVAPTCTATGLTEGKHCSVCNKVLVAQEVVKALDHTYDQNNADAKYLATPATCIAKATYYKSCTCGDFDAAKSEKFEYGGIAVDEHDWDEGVYTEPTCTADGYTTYTCKNNAEHKNVVTEENSKLDHTYDQNDADAKYLATPATCKEKATYYKSCICGHFDKEKSETFEVDGYADHTGGTATCEKKAVCTVCGEEYGVLAAHTPAEAVEENREEATCTQEGSYDSVVKCSVCDTEISRETKTIDKIAHSSVGIPAVAPTCTETGLTDGSKCSVCGETLVAQEVVAATGHALPEEWTVVTAPTCAEKGSEKRECTSCDYVETQDLDMIAHTPAEAVEENRVEATCTQEGSYDSVVKCSVCGDEISREVKTINKEEHTIDTTGHCVYCYASYVSKKVTASKSVSDLITEYGWDGNTTKQSFNLDENVSVKINGGTNTGKAYEGDHIRIYATDTPAGTITISVPEGYELVSIKISTQTGTYAFLYVDGTTTDISNVSTTVSGNEVVLNSVKNGSNGKQVRVTAFEVVYERPVLCEHTNRQAGETVEATCKEKGYTSYTCPDCGASFNWDYTVALEHEYDSVVTEPTCEDDGYTTHTCSKCGDSYTDTHVGSKLGHDVVVDEEIPATCIATGLTEGSHCSRCNEILVEQEEIAKTDCVDDDNDNRCDICDKTICEHTSFYEWVVVTPATCTEDGERTRQCKSCDYIDVETITALGHDLTNHDAKEPTCTEAGWDAYVTCSRCDHTTKVEKLALGHSEFTYVNNGSQHNKVCGVCEQTIETEDHDVDATGKCTICDTQLYSVYTYTFTSKQYSANGTVTLGTLDWTLAGDGGYWSYDGTKGHQFGSGNAPYKTLTLTSSALTGVQKIVINTSGASSIAAKFTVSVGGTNVGDVTSLTSTATDYTFSNINNLSGAVEFAYTQTSSKAIYIKSITIHYAAPCEHKHTESRAAVESTCSKQGTAAGTFCTDCQTYVSGGELLPLIDHSYGDWYDVINVTCTTNGSKTHKCSVCEFAETITTNATGHTETFVVTKDATCYQEGVKTYTCSTCNATRTESIPATNEHTYVNGQCTTEGCTATEGAGGGSTEEPEPTQYVDNFAIKSTEGTLDNKTITWMTGTGLTIEGAQADSSTAIRTADSDHYRVYQGSTLKIKAEGRKITKVVITVTESKYVDPCVNSVTTPNAEVTVDGTVVTIVFTEGVETVEFTASAQFRVKNIETTYLG